MGSNSKWSCHKKRFGHTERHQECSHREKEKQVKTQKVVTIYTPRRDVSGETNPDGTLIFTEPYPPEEWEINSVALPTHFFVFCYINISKLTHMSHHSLPHTYSLTNTNIKNEELKGHFFRCRGEWHWRLRFQHINGGYDSVHNTIQMKIQYRQLAI